MSDARADFEATSRHIKPPGWRRGVEPARPNMPIWACTDCRAGWPRDGVAVPPLYHGRDLEKYGDKPWTFGPIPCGGAWRESFLGDLPLVEYVP